MTRLLWFVAFLALTLLTQIGGVAMGLAWLAVRAPGMPLGGRRRAGIAVSAFAIAYAALTLFVVPRVAPLAGRVQLPCFAAPDRPFAAASPFLCALNRNYAVPRLAALLEALAKDMAAAYPGTITLYLDASFPFLDGFPMLPHLSHDDGRKLDLAFWYDDAAGTYLPGRLRSPIGYFAFERPPAGEPDRCRDRRWPTLRWDLEPLQPFFPPLPIDESRTWAALRWLFEEGRGFGVERVFVEPHLVKRLGVDSPVLAFQGCRAARHDDHIHVQIKMTEGR